jgi:beta-N-acetylhexosaminidase
MVRADNENFAKFSNDKDIIFTDYNIGGIFLDKLKLKEEYIDLITKYQDRSKIKLFIATDLEGAWNPFRDFINFPAFSEIKTKQEAYEIGLKHGNILQELGFNLNFAPISEFRDSSYGGKRTFNGTNKEIKDKIKNYILGLQTNVHGTCKHYPGKGMINNLHTTKDFQEISKSDLELFDVCIKNNISAIMIGHQIVTSELNSNDKPASVSKEIINTLSNFSGLIISDEINMKGLSSFYNSKIDVYQDLINSGNNIILDFEINKNSLNKLLEQLEIKVKSKKINETTIDNNVKKILIKKGYVLE